MNPDRRNTHRVWVGEDGCKIFIPEQSLIGNVLDVGCGGLSFEYTPCYHVIGEGSELEMYFHDGYRLHIPPLRCRIAYDRPDRSKGGYYRIFEVRRCGAHFHFGENGQPASLRRLITGKQERKAVGGMSRFVGMEEGMPLPKLRFA